MKRSIRPARWAARCALALLPAFFLTGLSPRLAQAGFLSAITAPAPGIYTLPSDQVQRDFATQLFRRTNEERAREGHRPLAYSAELLPAAKAHADDMIARDYFEHKSPEGNSAWDRVRIESPSALVFDVRENLYKTLDPDPGNIDELSAEAIQGWLDSPGHRANMMNDSSTHVAHAVAWKKLADGRADIVFVQVFGIDAGSFSNLQNGMWAINNTLPVEFYLFDRSHPQKQYPHQTIRNRVWVGGTPLALGADHQLRFPRIGEGHFEVGVRLTGTDGYSIFREFTRK